MKLTKPSFLSVLLVTFVNVGIAFGAPAVAGTVHVVEQDETFESIAEKVWNDASAWPAIWLATNEKSASDPSLQFISDAERLEPGQRLWIPDEPAAAVADDVLSLQKHGITKLSSYGLAPLPFFMTSYDVSFFDNPPPAHDPDYLAKVSPEHPHFLAVNGLRALSSYVEFIDDPRREEYLTRAKGLAAMLLSTKVVQDGAYTFPRNVRVKHFRGQWSSGLGHGEALAFFSQLYVVTNDVTYRDVADGIFRSFFLFAERPYASDHWFSMVDQDGYYWIEEYPRDYPTHLLNGFQYAVLGIHRYYMITGAPAAEFLLRASLATLSRYAREYRNPGWISDKGLTDAHGEHRDYLSMKHGYHEKHIDLFRQLYLISGDPEFYRVAKQMEWDRLAFENVRHTAGTITIRIEPPEALAQGAQWRRAHPPKTSSTRDFFDPTDWWSDKREPEVVPGDYLVEFTRVKGWHSPASMPVTVQPRKPTIAAAQYVRNYLTGPIENADALIDRFLWEIERDPCHGEAHFALGQLLQRRGNEAGAEASYRRALASGWASHLPGLHLARLHRSEGRTDDAVAEYQQLVAAYPTFSQGFLELGNLLAKAGKRDEAVAAYKRSITDPDPVTAEHTLFMLLHHNGLAGEARSMAERALALVNPDSRAAHLHKAGDIHRILGRADAAVAAYRTAIAKAPRWPAPHIALIRLFKSLRCEADARNVCAKGLRIYPHVGSIANECTSVVSITERETDRTTNTGH